MQAQLHLHKGASPATQVPLRSQTAQPAEPRHPRTARGAELAAAMPGGHSSVSKVSYTIGTCHAGFLTWLHSLLIQAIHHKPRSQHIPAFTQALLLSLEMLWPQRGHPMPMQCSARASLGLLGTVTVFRSTTLTKPTQMLQTFPSPLSELLHNSTHSPG